MFNKNSIDIELGSARNLRKSKSLSSYDGKRQSEPEPRTESKEKKEKRNSLRVRAQTFLSKIVGSKSKDSKDIEEPRSLSASPSLESPKPKASLETEKTHSTPKSPRDKSPRDKSPRSTKDKSPKDGSKKGKKSKKNRKRHDAWEKNQSNTNDAFRTFRRESKKRLKVIVLCMKNSNISGIRGTKKNTHATRSRCSI